MKSFEQIKSQQVQVVKKAVAVECVTELACSLGEILSLGAKSTILNQEVLEDKVNFKGRTIFNIVYLLEGEIRRKEFGIEFTDFCNIDKKENYKISTDCIVEGVSAKRGEKLSLESIVNVNVYLEENKEDNLLKEEDTCLCRKLEQETTQLKSVVSKTFNLDDEMELDKRLKNVLCNSGTAHILSVQCGIGSIICDGEIILSLALLPEEEKSDIIKENRIIPFRLELEDSSVNVNDLASAIVTVNSVMLKVRVDEEKNYTNLLSQIELIISARAFKVTNVCYTDDMFSTQKQLSIAKENVDIKNFIKQKSISEKINGKAFCIPPENSRIVCTLEERVYGISYKYEQGNIFIEGVASCYITFQNISTGELSSKLAEMPFALQVADEFMVEDVKVVCRTLNAKIRNDEVELDGELLIAYNTYKKHNIVAITSVTEGDDLPKSNYAFSIYNPQKTDTLWDIAKTLKITEQEILDQNENLTFPLNGTEKILIYKKA